MIQLASLIDFSVLSFISVASRPKLYRCGARNNAFSSGHVKCMMMITRVMMISINLIHLIYPQHLIGSQLLIAEKRTENCEMDKLTIEAVA